MIRDPDIWSGVWTVRSIGDTRMKSVVLFDIDGTIVTRASQEPSSKQLAYTVAIREVYGIPGLNYMDYPIFGLTDRGILHLLLGKNGIPDHEIIMKENVFRDRLLSIHTELLEDREQQFKALPGARLLLEWLNKQGTNLLLATGNYQPLAKFKLQEAGLSDYFADGGFGEDGIARTDIVKAAIGRSGCKDLHMISLLGDTPSDLTAAREAGVLGFAVATGMFSTETLKVVAGSGESVFADLMETEEIGNRLSGRIQINSESNS